MAQTTSNDAVTFLQRQHDDIRALFAGIADAAPEERGEAFQPLLRLLAVHETAEEMVVHPALRGTGEEGARLADELTAEEDEAKKALSDLEAVDASSTEFEKLFALLRRRIEAHASHEEERAFPVLSRDLDEAALARMTPALQVAEGMAPTHPHTWAPESAVGNVVVGPFVAMVDRARDALHDVTH